MIPLLLKYIDYMTLFTNFISFMIIHHPYLDNLNTFLLTEKVKIVAYEIY